MIVIHSSTAVKVKNNKIHAGHIITITDSYSNKHFTFQFPRKKLRPVFRIHHGGSAMFQFRPHESGSGSSRTKMKIIQKFVKILILTTCHLYKRFIIF